MNLTLTPAVEQMYVKLLQFRSVLKEYWYEHCVMELNMKPIPRYVQMTNHNRSLSLTIFPDAQNAFLSSALQECHNRSRSMYAFEDSRLEFSTEHITIRYLKKRELPVWQQTACSDVARKNGIRLAGQNAFPCITICHAQTLSDELVTEEQAIYISDVLEACRMGFPDVYDIFRAAFRPAGQPISNDPPAIAYYPQGAVLLPDLPLRNAETVATFPKHGTYSLCVVNSVVPVYDPFTKRMCFPYLLQLQCKDDPEMPFAFHFHDPFTDLEQVTERMIAYWHEKKTIPGTIVVDMRDKIAWKMAETLEKKLGITCEINMDLSPMLLAQLMMIVFGNQERDPLHESEAFVIRVTVDKTTYRDIEISVRDTFDSLSKTILSAYQFDDTHLYTFQVSYHSVPLILYGNAYDHDHQYPENGIPWYLKLEDAGLGVGDEFTYLFDYGDDWRFTCKVLERKPYDGKEPKIIGSQGIAPKQYYI